MKRTAMKTALIVMLLCAVAVAAGSCTKSSDTASSVNMAYRKVMQTRTLRAAYITYPPAVMKDAQTGKMSGIFVETLERAAGDLGWKVVWTEEVGWGDQIAGLTANRYDIVGSPVWANATRAKLTTLSRPVYYSGVGIYVRKDDDRFTKSQTAIDDPKVRIATIDGETSDLLARTRFPRAQRLSLPQLTDVSEVFLQLTSGKADVGFAEPFYGSAFLQKNPGSIVNIAEAAPITTLGNCFMLKPDEPQLKQALDVTIEDLQNSGFIDRIIDKYEPSPNTFYRVAKPYRVVMPSKSAP